MSDRFWLEQATEADYSDPSIPIKGQVKYLTDAIKPVVYATDVPLITEFGCGYGRLTREVQRAFPKALVTGIDINPKIIAEAKKRDKDAVYGVRADLTGSPKQNAIYCVQVLQHMPTERKQQFFKEAAAILKRGGVLAFQYVEGTTDTFLTDDAQFKRCIVTGKQIGRAHV